jgi:hypothetical protein
VCFWTTIFVAGMLRTAMKNHQTASRQAQDGCHLWIPRTVNNKAEKGRVSIKFTAPEFLLGCQPVVEPETILVPALFKKLASTFGDS